MIILVSVGIAVAAVQILVYVVHNRRVTQGKSRPEIGSKPVRYII